MKVFEKNNNIFRILSEAISEGIIVVNDDQIIVATNGAANEIFGFEEDELIGKTLSVLIPKEYHHRHQSHFENFVDYSGKRKMGSGRDLFGIRKNGKKFPVEVGLNPFVIYDNNYVMALVSDITFRKEQEEQIHELNTELERKIEKRTKELHCTIKELEEEIKLREEAEAITKESLKKERDLKDRKSVV